MQASGGSSAAVTSKRFPDCKHAVFSAPVQHPEGHVAQVNGRRPQAPHTLRRRRRCTVGFLRPPRLMKQKTTRHSQHPPARTHSGNTMTPQARGRTPLYPFLSLSRACVTSVKCRYSSRFASQSSPWSYPKPVTRSDRRTSVVSETRSGWPLQWAPPPREAVYCRWALSGGREGLHGAGCCAGQAPLVRAGGTEIRRGLAEGRLMSAAPGVFASRELDDAARDGETPSAHSHLPGIVASWTL